MPLVALDRDGTVRTTTRAARQLLEYGPEASLQSSFFGYVHPRHRRRVMRDLADMVSRGMRQAQWLLRLRTGNERWRWYRASAHNHLGDDAERVFVHLRPL
jgi:PAS domain-containing protein